MIFKRRKPRLTLHIGFGKTGTTVLQEFLWSNRKVLAKHDILYPDYGVEAGAHHLLSPHIPPDLEAAWNFIHVSEWAPRLARERRKQFLLSSELIVAADADSTRDFCTGLLQHFATRIVVYLRRQDDILMATYNQNVKSGRQFRRLADVYQNMLHRFDYASIVSRWAQHVGAENVIVRPYEQAQFHSQDIRRDFLFHVFGIEDTSDFTFQRGDPNPRLDLGAVEYKRMLNCTVDDPKKLQRFQELLIDFSREKFTASKVDTMLSRATRDEILEHFETGNTEIARRFMLRQDGRLFLEPIPDTQSLDDGFSLSRDQSKIITNYLAARDAKLMQWLAGTLTQHLESERPVVRTAAKRLAAILALQ